MSPDDLLLLIMAGGLALVLMGLMLSWLTSRPKSRLAGGPQVSQPQEAPQPQVIKAPLQSINQSTLILKDTSEPLSEPPLDEKERVRLAVQKHGSAVEFVMRREHNHLLFIGGSGLGKTSVVHAAAVQLAQAHPLEIIDEHLVQGMLVCDPDAYPGKWLNTKVFGAGNDYETIADACELVLNEYEERVNAQGQGVRDFEPLWLVLDEYWDLWHRDDRIKNAVERVLRRGRKLNVHLWLGSQDNQAASIGMSGETELMKNFSAICEMYLHFDGVRFLIPKRYVGGGQNQKISEGFAVPWIEMPKPPVMRSYREQVLEGLLEPRTVVQKAAEPQLEPQTAVPANSGSWVREHIRSYSGPQPNDDETLKLEQCWQTYSSTKRETEAICSAFEVSKGSDATYQQARFWFKHLQRQAQFEELSILQQTSAA